MAIHMNVRELQGLLSRTQVRIKKLETKTREYLIAHENDPNGEIENLWAEIEFLQAKEEALLTQISLQSENTKDLDHLFEQIRKELHKDT